MKLPILHILIFILNIIQPLFLFVLWILIGICLGILITLLIIFLVVEPFKLTPQPMPIDLTFGIWTVVVALSSMFSTLITLKIIKLVKEEADD